jgi:cell fate (sporulation/competence/biofilm development) regulator YlbF (YheA/YmcA/DUF963 family)
MSHEAEARRGELAKQVLDNPVYAEAYASIEAALVRAWRDARDVKDREQAHQMLTMLDKVKSVMEGVMRSGQVAEKELERKRSLTERVLRR